MMSAGTFSIYGNYFTVNTYNSPIVAPQSAQTTAGKPSNDDNGLSSSQIFRFHVLDSLVKDPSFNHANYVYNFYAFGINDNDQSVSVEEAQASQRHMLGVYGFKLAKATYNFNAVNATRYYITAMVEYDCQTVNLNYTKFYDAWQTHINTWTSNNIDDKNATVLHANHTPAIININNSFVAKAGGPVILSMNDYPSYPANCQSKNIVNVDANSTLYSYVKGDEAWFIANKISEQAVTIGALNGFFQLNGATFKTQLGENSNEFMNMIMITMDAHYIPGVDSGDPADVDGKLVIGGNAVLDMDDYTNVPVLLPGVGATTMNTTYGNPYVDVVRAQAAAQGSPVPPPIFVSSVGGVGYTDMQTFTDTLGNGGVYQGDYLALYYFNLGIVLGFNQSKLPAEPAAPTAPWSTVARAYN